MKPTEVTMIELENPTLELPDMSYGYSNERIRASQIDTSRNRNIPKIQTFAFELYTSLGTTDGAEHLIIPSRMGQNKQKQTTYTGVCFQGDNSLTYRTTLSYNTDFTGEYIMKLAPGAVVEVSGYVSRATEYVRMAYTGTGAFLWGGTLTITSLTQTSFALMNTGNTFLKINLYYRDTALGSPSFGVFMKVYY